MVDWSAVVTGGSVAALVTFGLNMWLTRPRADLRMASIGHTIDLAERMYRAQTDGDTARFRPHWDQRGVVRLTNYGDGTAFDIRLSGSDCRPRVWLADMGNQQMHTPIDDDGTMRPPEAIPPALGWPMWSDKLSALGPGESVDVIVMSSPDTSRPKPVLEVSWSWLPRRGLGRRKFRYDLATARSVECGWPGKTDTAGD
ncbi:hypothetical protein C0J29_13760 [Mycobacterium paragordonae]|uniref:hypothetical protein n=1 Tax=Mycobacterium paragordonae TaxID=1389713 RepID=UPI000EA9A94A|nr:hypothetical protein [Mycobacterium paragordonae]AYE95711.1 hypothetical protein C0J29_13760 [Mycobacterium paragordonae]